MSLLQVTHILHDMIEHKRLDMFYTVADPGNSQGITCTAWIRNRCVKFWQNPIKISHFFNALSTIKIVLQVTSICLTSLSIRRK